MCKVLDEIENRGILKGKAEGIAEGIAEGKKEGQLSLGSRLIKKGLLTLIANFSKLAYSIKNYITSSLAFPEKY